MKLSRDELKGIVKECLVEILSEGLVNTAATINETKQQNMQTRQRNLQEIPRSNVNDKISFLPKQQTQQQPQRQQVDRNTINAVTTDPILREMLADTAMNGTAILDEARGNAYADAAVAMNGDVAAKVMSKKDPTELFSDSASKWATLAFAEKKKAI